MLVTLPDGLEVLIRPITAADKTLLVWGLERLSDRSRYQRFLSPKPSFTRNELRYLTELDGTDHVALVAVNPRRPSQLFGVARFVREPDDPTTAEAAVTIGDPMQGRGIGRALGLALADEARARGIHRFSATMLSDNAAAFRLFRSISDRLSTSELHGATRELIAELDPAPVVPLRPAAATALRPAA